MLHTKILLLAAGKGSRMEAPKQLLEKNGLPMIRHSLQQLTTIHADKVQVVLGAYAEQIQAVLKTEQVDIIHNPDWEEGMGSSLRVGLQNLLLQYPDTQRMLVALADQPLIRSVHYHNLLKLQEAYPSQIVASYYKHRIGVPAVFPDTYFQQILQARGDKGARKWLNQSGGQVWALPCAPAALDIDRPEDLLNWLNYQKV